MQQQRRWPQRSSKSLSFSTAHSSRWALCAFGFLVLALVALPVVAATPPVKPGVVTATMSTLHDGVVVDAAQSAVYVMNPAGGIDAMGLDGQLLWHSDAAAKPLAVASGALVAQADASDRAGELRLVALDARSGDARFQSTVALPTGVYGTAVDHLGKSFRIAAAAQGNGVLLSWKSIETPRQGYLPAESEALAPVNKARGNEGTLRLDLGSGNVAPAAKAAFNMANLRQLEQPLKGLADRQFLSLDGQYVLVTRPAVGEGRIVHRWMIYERDNGNLVGSVESPVGASPFHVSGRTLVYVTQPSITRQGEEWVDQPLMVRAFDLSSGIELWTKEAEDTAFRGPFPP